MLDQEVPQIKQKEAALVYTVQGFLKGTALHIFSAISLTTTLDVHLMLPSNASSYGKGVKSSNCYHRKLMMQKEPTNVAPTTMKKGLKVKG